MRKKTITITDKWAKHKNSSQKRKYTQPLHTFFTRLKKVNLALNKGNTQTLFFLLQNEQKFQCVLMSLLVRLRKSRRSHNCQCKLVPPPGRTLNSSYRHYQHTPPWTQRFHFWKSILPADLPSRKMTYGQGFSSPHSL